MERSMELQTDEKFLNAVETLSQLGFPKSLIKRTVRSILKLYEGEWELIEENGYQVVVERILEEQDGYPDETKASKKMCHNSRTAKSEHRTSVTIIKQQQLAPDPARDSAIKLGKGSDSNYLSAVGKLYEQFKQRAHSSSLPPLVESDAVPPAAGTSRPAPISADPSSSGSKDTADILNAAQSMPSPPSVPPSPIPSPPSIPPPIPSPSPPPPPPPSPSPPLPPPPSPSPPLPPPPPPSPPSLPALPSGEPSPFFSLEFLPPPPPLPPNLTPLHISMYPPPPDTQPSPPGLPALPAELQAVEHFQPLPPLPYISKFPVAEPPVWDNQQAFSSPWGSNPYPNEWSFPQAPRPFPAVWDNQAPLRFPPASTSSRGCGGWLEDDEMQD